MHHTELLLTVLLREANTNSAPVFPIRKDLQLNTCVSTESVNLMLLDAVLIPPEF